MDFSLAKIVAIATLLWVLGTSGGTEDSYDGLSAAATARGHRLSPTIVKSR